MLSPGNNYTKVEKVWPEPFPDWPKAIRDWGWMWPAHIFGFGILFALLTLHALYCLYRFYKTAVVRQRIHLLTVNLELFIAGLGRSLGLFRDPYFSSRSSFATQNLIILISSGVATACITSAFSIMLLIFLQTTKTKLGSPTLRNLTFLTIMTLSNIIYMVMTNLIVWFYPQTKVMIFTCHITFALWGAAISVGYFVAGSRMWRNLKPTLQTPSAHRHDQCFLRDARRLKRLFFLMGAASVFGIAKFALSLYVSAGEFGVFSDERYAKHWPWFSIQTTLRILELLLSALVLRIGVKSRKDCDQRVIFARKTIAEKPAEAETAS